MAKINNFFYSITNKLMLSFLAITLIPLLAVSYFVNINAQKQLEQNFINSTIAEIKQVDNTINYYFTAISENTDYLSNHPLIKNADSSITSYIDKSDSSGYLEMTPSQNGGIETQIYNIYSDFAKAHPQTAYVYMATKWGGYIQWPEGKTMEKYDPRVRPFYKTAIENPGKIVRTRPYYFEADDAVIISTVKTITNDLGQLIGVQGLDVSLKGLTQIVKSIKIGQTGYIILTEKDGTILAHPKKPELNFKNISALNVEKLNQIVQIESGHFLINVDGTDCFANIYTSPLTGWKFIAIISEAELLKNVSQIQKIILIIFIIFLAITLVVSFFLSKQFSKPLLTTVAHLKLMGEGNFTNSLPENQMERKDEFGFLSNGVNTMQQSIQKLLLQIKDSTNTVVESANYLSDITDQSKNAAQDVAAAIEEITHSALSQASDLENASTKMKELDKSVDLVLDSTNEMNKLSLHTENLSEQGLLIVRALTEKSDDTKKATIEVNKVISAMDKMSEEIGTITESIEHIAEQTNLLALNASIEAARAGTYGKGFAVVAEEIRNLAEQSAKSAGHIKDLLSNIQQQSRKAVEAIIKTEASINSQNKTVEETKNIFEKISTSITSILEKVAEVQEYNKTMKDREKDLVEIIENISSISEETSANTEEVSAATQEQLASMEQVSDLANRLKTLAERLEKELRNFIID